MNRVRLIDLVIRQGRSLTAEENASALSAEAEDSNNNTLMGNPKIEDENEVRSPQAMSLP